MSTNNGADTQAIKEKIARLMAMGTDERTNEFEAEAALRQASKLMAMHNIDVAEIQARTGSKPVYNWRTVCVPPSRKPTNSCVKWFGQLALGIALFTDCKAAWKVADGHGMCIAFSGDAVDVEYAVWLCKHLRDSTRWQSKLHVGSRRDHESFRRAMVARLCERMRALLQERNAELNATPCGAGTALVIVNNKIAARDAQFGKMSTRRSSYSHTSAADAGRAAGDRVGIGRPTAHGGAARALSHG